MSSCPATEPFSTWRLCWSSRRVGLPGPRPRGGLTCIIGDLAAADGAPAAASRRVLGQVEKGWLPAAAFTTIYPTVEAAIPVAIEGVDDVEIDEVRIVAVGTGRVAWRSTEEEFE
ncbi:hypothetical protein Ae717Ps2_7101c [Pseudonocardia sp. Ae717_Ps2]|nr:hypothetical protein Ae717Ps2_7101c [Pseudonocardia sp. Ae717_Ps2]